MPGDNGGCTHLRGKIDRLRRGPQCSFRIIHLALYLSQSLMQHCGPGCQSHCLLKGGERASEVTRGREVVR